MDVHPGAQVLPRSTVQRFGRLHCIRSDGIVYGWWRVRRARWHSLPADVRQTHNAADGELLRDFDRSHILYAPSFCVRLSAYLVLRVFPTTRGTALLRASIWSNHLILLLPCVKNTYDRYVASCMGAAGDIFREAQAQLALQAAHTGDQSGTTATVAVITDANIMITYVGDSRACVVKSDGRGELRHTARNLAR